MARRKCAQHPKPQHIKQVLDRAAEFERLGIKEDDTDKVLDNMLLASWLQDYARLLEDEDQRLYNERMAELIKAQKFKKAKANRAARHQARRARPENKKKQNEKRLTRWRNKKRKEQAARWAKVRARTPVGPGRWVVM